jgi:DNA-binding beta-propeller fold protein YncE
LARVRSLIILTLILLLTLASLAYLYFYVLNNNNEKAQVEGLTHLSSIYGWGPSPDQLLKKPHGIAIDDQDNIYCTLPTRGKVVVFDKNGSFIRTFGSKGSAPGSLRGPLGVAVDSKHNRVYVADRARFRLVIFDLRGNFIKETRILSPVTPYVGNNRLYLGTYGPLAILSLEGKLLDTWGARSRNMGDFDYPQGVATDSRGNVYVSDTNNTRLVAMNKKGDILWVVGQPPQKTIEPKNTINLPAGLCIDDQDRLFVVDSFDFTIRAYNTHGRELAKFGTGSSGNLDGQFNMADGIAFMGNHTFAVADKYNDRIQIVRLMLPEEAGNLNNYWWLLLLLIPLLLALLKRKKFIVNDDFAELVIENQKLRLLAKVAKHIYVAPKVFERFKDYEEEGLLFSDIAAIRPYTKKEFLELMRELDVEEKTAVALLLARKSLFENITLYRFIVALEDPKARELIEVEYKRTRIINYNDFIQTHDTTNEEE